MAQEPIRSRPARILIVEDDPGDLNLIKRFLEDTKIKNEVYEALDGREAIDFLYHQGRFSDAETAPRPDLILLDLNLPKVDGRELLAELKEDSHLRNIPVVVLTTSEEESDVWRSYNLGASSYIVKPVDMDQLMRIVRTIKEYWFQVVILPPE